MAPGSGDKLGHATPSMGAGDGSLPSPEERLAGLGLRVPAVAAPVAAYVPAIRSGKYVFSSGQLPMSDGALLATGRVGAEVSPETAFVCAQQCVLNAIAAIKEVVGDLRSVARVVKVVVFVASAEHFTGHPMVANGASELLVGAFGELGIHARCAVGVASLPLGAPVEVEVMVEVARPGAG